MAKEEKATSDNPEVQAAMNERDKLLAGVKKAIEKVDRLVAEYSEWERGNR
jgi:hypothetical protein